MSQGHLQILLQLTDTHIVPEGAVLSGNVDTCAYLRRGVTQIKRLSVQPQAIVVTGDLVDDGQAQSYHQFLSIMSELDMPVYALRGNHDDCSNFVNAFSDLPFDQKLLGDGFVQYAVDLGAVRLVALDTTVLGQPYGALCKTRLQWLANTLAQDSQRPTIVGMHHPPFQTGMVKMDGIGLRDGSAELEEIIVHNPQVQRIICGHVHRMCVQSFGGSVAMTAPSAAHQLALQFAHTEPMGYTFEPSGAVVHVWRESEVKVVSHLLSLADYEGPFTLE